MQDYISISTLNDFISCPYSIYLHNVYMNADEDVYHAKPHAKTKKFEGGDSIFIFETDEKKAVKYGNAIHRDQDLIYFT